MGISTISLPIKGLEKGELAVRLQWGKTVDITRYWELYPRFGGKGMVT